MAIFPAARVLIITQPGLTGDANFSNCHDGGSSVAGRGLARKTPAGANRQGVARHLTRCGARNGRLGRVKPLFGILGTAVAVAQQIYDET
jgi:hypothetical protein